MEIFLSFFPFISNRQSIETSYTHEEDGWKYSWQSSVGNEFLEEQEKENFGEDVTWKSYINLIGLKPYEGGVKIRQVNKVDVNGNVPTFVKNYAIEHLTKAMIYIVDYYKDGIKPWIL